MTVQSDLPAARRGIKLQSDGLKKVSELDHVFVSIQRHDCGEPEELVNNHRERVMSEPLRIVSPRLFVRPLQVTTQGPTASPPLPLRPSPPPVLLILWFLRQILIKDAGTCAACVQQPDQGGLWKKHLSASSKSDGSLSVSLLPAENDITAHYWPVQRLRIYLQLDGQEEVRNDGDKRCDCDTLCF